MTYAVASGQPVNGGRYSWMPTRLYEWVSIPNTSGAGGASIDAYSGLAFKPSTCEIISAASGGHPIADNSVVSISLLQDTPVLVTRIAPSLTGISTTLNSNSRGYNADGKPCARHVYSYIQYVPATDRVVLCGSRYMFASATDSSQTDAVNCAGWTWDAEGANGNVGNASGTDISGGFGGGIDNAGRIYTTGGKLWTDSTKTWSTHPLTLGRYPTALDSLRNQLFSLQVGNGTDGAGSIFATVGDVAAGTNRTITLAGPGLAQFTADAPSYAAMDYDAVNDQYVFYCGQGSGAGRLYIIKPNSGSTWVISIQALGSSSVTPDEPSRDSSSNSSGLHKRFGYAPKLRGFWMLPQAASNIYFLRTA